MHKLRSQVDAILIGSNTLHRDDPLLTVRYTKGKNPTRIVLDSKGTMSSRSKILKTAKQVPTIIAVSKSVSQKNLKRLEKFPVDVIVSGDKQINIRQLLRKLVSKKIKTVLVEGGGTVNWDFVKNNLFDKLVVTVSPKIIGGVNAVSLVQGPGFASIKSSAKLRLDKTTRIGSELVLYYSKSVS